MGFFFLLLLVVVIITVIGVAIFSSNENNGTSNTPKTGRATPFFLHLSPWLGFIIMGLLIPAFGFPLAFMHIALPLIVWLGFRNRNNIVARHGGSLLWAQVVYTLYFIVLLFALQNFFGPASIVELFSFVFGKSTITLATMQSGTLNAGMTLIIYMFAMFLTSVVGTIKAADNKNYTYPLTFDFLRRLMFNGDAKAVEKKGDGADTGPF